MKNTKFMKKIKAGLGILFLSYLIVWGMQEDTFAATVNQDIVVTNIENTQTGISLQWTNSYSAQGYLIYRSVNGSAFESYDTTTKKNYVDTNIETGQRYSYMMQSYKITKNKKKYSVLSTSTEPVVALPNAPTNVSVTFFDSYASVSWTTNPEVSGYVLYRSTDEIVWEEVGETDSNTGIYNDYNIVSGMTYYYKAASYEVVDGERYTGVVSNSTSEFSQKGIDVSYHNGKINWKKVKDTGISFAMIRLGYGTTKGGIVDKKLDYNYREAKKYGIKVGFYFYSYADNVKEAKKEAKFTEKLLQKYGDIDYPVSFDFENAYRNKKKYKKSNTKIITTYCDYLEKRGYDTSVYTYHDFLKKAVNYNKVSKYGIWLARWTHNANTYSSKGIPNVEMWQYSDRGRVKGINSAVDLNLYVRK